MTPASFLIVDTNTKPSRMRCLCCGDSHPLDQCKLSTAVAIMEAFSKVHLEAFGCSDEKYKKVLEETKKQKFLRDIEPMDRQMKCTECNRVVKNIKRYGELLVCADCCDALLKGGNKLEDNK